ncbi:glycosyltransferase [Aurantimicrobium minutum]|uniref:glycosyltransferase n=1 Tax=Aurantimicrobium minutum TaxID=708131 RepID=UPI0024769861|nr:glycosyltransferase [Aurantimicrobium minutum]MDH6239017.1 glycosyltransferase involved in cell wall biosynthesis [Aurantimicrobium minutum]
MRLQIFMPFYGNPEHFRLAVESVIAQTDSEWTLTILDDCYPDSEPGKWVVSLNDSRISYKRNSTNLLPSKNYNQAIDISSSEFIMLMGCDDLLLPNFVERSKQLIEEASPDVAVIQPGVVVIDENGHQHNGLADRVKRKIGPWPISGHRMVSGEQAHVGLLKGNWTYFPSILWRVSSFGSMRFRTDLNIVQDLSMILNLVESNKAILVDSEISFCYRRHKQSLSGATGIDGSKFVQESILFSEAQNRALQRGWKKSARAAKWHLLSRFNALGELPGALLTRNTKGARNLLRHIFMS